MTAIGLSNTAPNAIGSWNQGFLMVFARASSILIISLQMMELSYSSKGGASQEIQPVNFQKEVGSGNENYDTNDGNEPKDVSKAGDNRTWDV